MTILTLPAKRLSWQYHRGCRFAQRDDGTYVAQMYCKEIGTANDRPAILNLIDDHLLHLNDVPQAA